MVYAPRILQGLCAAACDCAVYRLARRWFDETTAQWALACSLFSWFNCFCAVRPFSNCLEATLCTTALSLWPFDPPSNLHPDHNGTRALKSRSSVPRHHRVAALLLGATACSLRPPIALLWIVLGGHQLLWLLQANASETNRVPIQSIAAACVFLCEAVVCVALVFVACGVIDRVMYGEWTFPPWNFLVWNAVTVRRYTQQHHNAVCSQPFCATNVHVLVCRA